MIHSNIMNKLKKKKCNSKLLFNSYHIYGYCDYKIFLSIFNSQLKNHKTENEILSFSKFFYINLKNHALNFWILVLQYLMYAPIHTLKWQDDGRNLWFIRAFLFAATGTHNPQECECETNAAEWKATWNRVN